MEPSSGSVHSAPEIFASEFFRSKAGLAKSVPGAEKVMGGCRSEGLGIYGFRVLGFRLGFRDRFYGQPSGGLLGSLRASIFS